MPNHPETAEEVVQRTLADCEGDREAALLLLAHTLVNARRGICHGFLHQRQPARPS